MLWPKFTLNTYSKSYTCMWSFSYPMIFELDDLWPLMTFKGQIDILIACISWIVHVIIWICVNNKSIWLPGNYGSNFEQYLNWLQLDPILLLVNVSHELAQIMTTYDFRSATQAILSNVRINFNLIKKIVGKLLTEIYDLLWAKQLTSAWYILVNFSHELAHIMTTYDFLSAKQGSLSNVWTDSNFTQFCLWSTFHMNWPI